MSAQLAIELIEPKESLLFVAGIGITPLAIGATFTDVHRIPASKQKIAQPAASVALTIETLIIDGEPADDSAAETSVLLALSGDYQPLLAVVAALKWRRKGGRWLRTTEDSLLLIGS